VAGARRQTGSERVFQLRGGDGCSPVGTQLQLGTVSREGTVSLQPNRADVCVEMCWGRCCQAMTLHDSPPLFPNQDSANGRECTLHRASQRAQGFDKSLTYGSHGLIDLIAAFSLPLNTFFAWMPGKSSSPPWGSCSFQNALLDDRGFPCTSDVNLRHQSYTRRHRGIRRISASLGTYGR